MPPFGKQPPATGNPAGSPKVTPGPRPTTPAEKLVYADDLGSGLAPGDVDPAALGGIDAQHFALKLGGPDGKAVGLFRAATDDDAGVLTLERLTATGEWEDDPNLIHDLHEPGCYAVDDNEAVSIQHQILGADDTTAAF
jgi:hypothetical protein